MLHDWRIEPSEYDRHDVRRGRRHAFERIDPASTALVVVDMIPFFVEENPYTRGIVANIDRLATALRSAGGTVAWIVPALMEPSAVDEEFFGSEIAATYAAAGGEGSVRDRLWPAFDVDAVDVVAEKSAASAFFPGRCNLSEQLDERGIDTVLIAGTVANVCCESTARDAKTLGYRVVMIADANSAVDDESLNATLRTIYRSFGDVRTVDDVLRLVVT